MPQERRDPIRLNQATAGGKSSSVSVTVPKDPALYKHEEI